MYCVRGKGKNESCATTAYMYVGFSIRFVCLSACLFVCLVLALPLPLYIMHVHLSTRSSQMLAHEVLF